MESTITLGDIFIMFVKRPIQNWSIKLVLFRPGEEGKLFIIFSHYFIDPVFGKFPFDSLNRGI